MSNKVTREDLIEYCEGNIERLEITLKNGTSDTPRHVQIDLWLMEMALDSLKGEAPYHCEHDGATYYDMSGHERCGRCGADI